MKSFFFLLSLFFALHASAEMVDTFQFKNQADRTRAVELAKSLRCPQCQNQNLVESNSPIAYDLRLEVYKMVGEGKSNQAIIDVMTARFGNFVNYKPPFQWNTALLWLLPIILLLLAFGLIAFSHRPTHKELAISRTAQPIPSTSHCSSSSETNKASAVKFNWKLTLIVWGLLLLIPLAYYFSLARFELVQTGEQAEMTKKNQQIKMPTEQKNQDIIGNIQQKLRQDPNDDNLWLQLGEAYVQNNEFDNALIAYANATKIVGEKPNILGLAATALYYQADQRITPHIQQLLDVALQQDPKEISSLSLLAAEAFKNKDYANAQHYWQQILDSGKPSVDRREIIQRMKMVEFLDKK